MVKEFGLDAYEWTIEPAARLEVGPMTKIVALPKLSLLSDPGYEHNDDFASIVNKTMKCNKDYRRCYLEGYFEILTVLGADLNNFVEHNLWVTSRIYFVRTANAIGAITLAITAFAGEVILSIVAPQTRHLLK
ncbi:hypothetical protein BGZ80_002990 [Entomortierella chlamydospora]|uniref:Uncharacterized protein n=1 Tax=Entomortierella chlamydospora TaxID=101097 RepID=A0A9P6MPJ0_9FUNG|nr:hypothetical protein BGZ80_002990 [Entomortierella chlamydospora]